jgi:SAM-dependent methyltransferase
MESSPIHLSPDAPPTFDSEAAWYEISSPDHFWFEWRVQVIREVFAAASIPMEQPLRVLDVGCGVGVLKQQLEGMSQWTVDGADLNLESLERAARGGRGTLYYYDIRSRHHQLVHSYDLVLICDVLEHLEDPRGFLRAAIWHLKPGGHLLVNVPARPRLLGAYDRAVGHLRRYTVASLLDELPEGLREEEIRGWGVLLLPVLAVRSLVFRGEGERERTIRRGMAPGRIADRLLRLAMSAEMKLPLRCRFGSSIAYLGRLEE